MISVHPETVANRAGGGTFFFFALVYPLYISLADFATCVHAAVSVPAATGSEYTSGRSLVLMV